METKCHYWSEFFSHWPSDLPRRGVLVTAFNEQISFSAFWTSENLLMLERQTPDFQGTRTVVVPYDQIQGLKIMDLIKLKHIKAAGFEEAATKPSRSE